MIDPYLNYDDIEKIDSAAKEILTVMIKNKLSFGECEQVLHRTEFVLRETTYPYLSAHSAE